MTFLIRSYRESDTDDLIEILKLNNQYDYPEVEGADSMRRVAKCSAALFWVAIVDGKPRGFVKAIYDGSRALIHLLSIHPDYQRAGIGSSLIKAATLELNRRGAPTITVTATQESRGFWEKQGFRQLPVFVMLKELDHQTMS